MAVALVGLSTLGTVAAIDGGWAGLAAFTPSLTALGGGIVLQGLCTAVQWLYRRRRWSLPYLLALGFSAGPTAYGYWPIVSAPLAQLAGFLGATGQASDAVIVLAVVAAAVLVDYLPEARLIDG